MTLWGAKRRPWAGAAADPVTLAKFLSDPWIRAYLSSVFLFSSLSPPLSACFLSVLSLQIPRKSLDNLRMWLFEPFSGIYFKKIERGSIRDLFWSVPFTNNDHNGRSGELVKCVLDISWKSCGASPSNLKKIGNSLQGIWNELIWKLTSDMTNGYRKAHTWGLWLRREQIGKLPAEHQKQLLSDHLCRISGFQGMDIKGYFLWKVS